MKIQFKVRPDADDGERRRVVHDVARAERLFLEDDDPELATLYVADVPDDRAAEALDQLQHSGAVEFAEPQPQRHLRR